MQKNAITSDTMVSQVEAIVSSPIHEETALLSIESGSYYGMDKVASRIWELIAQPVTVKRVVDQLTSDYEVDRGTCESHVIKFLEQLSDSGLVEIIGHGTSA